MLVISSVRFYKQELDLLGLYEHNYITAEPTTLTGVAHHNLYGHFNTTSLFSKIPQALMLLIITCRATIMQPLIYLSPIPQGTILKLCLITMSGNLAHSSFVLLGPVKCNQGNSGLINFTNMLLYLNE